MIIKRIGPVSCARISGTLYAIIGLFAGALFSVAAVLGSFNPSHSARGGLAAALGMGAIVAFPILYGAFGFVTTLIVAWLYNVLAGAVGGIHIDLE